MWVPISQDYKLNWLILEFLYFICQVASGRTLQSNFVVFKSSCHLPLSSTGVTNLSDWEQPLVYWFMWRVKFVAGLISAKELTKLILRRLAAFGDFRVKTTETQVVLHGNFSGSVSATDPVKGSKDAASLLVCTRKIFLCGGCGCFVSDVIRGGLLGHLVPLYLSPGANH